MNQNMHLVTALVLWDLTNMFFLGKYLLGEEAYEFAQAMIPQRIIVLVVFYGLAGCFLG